MMQSCLHHAYFQHSCAHNFSEQNYSTTSATIATMKLNNTIYVGNNKQNNLVADDDDQSFPFFILGTPGSKSVADEVPPTKRAKTFRLQPRRSAIVIGCAVVVLVSSPLAHAFAIERSRMRSSLSTQLNYRSLHHGPDVEPLTHIERQGVDFTKMPKDKLDRFGPGSFDQYSDNVASNDIFDGGDSEMGLAGDGQNGLHQIGHDVSPHLVNTMAARFSSEEEVVLSPHTSIMTYAEELMHSNPSSNEIRELQLQNWATQREIASANRWMNEKTELYHDAGDSYIGYNVSRNEYTFDAHMSFCVIVVWFLTPPLLLCTISYIYRKKHRLIMTLHSKLEKKLLIASSLWWHLSMA